MRNKIRVRETWMSKQVSSPSPLPTALPFLAPPFFRPCDDGAPRNLWPQEGHAFLCTSQVSHQPPEEHPRPTMSVWSAPPILLAGSWVCSQSTTLVTLMASY